MDSHDQPMELNWLCYAKKRLHMEPLLAIEHAICELLLGFYRLQ
jgi:hypothetical protein